MGAFLWKKAISDPLYKNVAIVRDMEAVPQKEPVAGSGGVLPRSNQSRNVWG